MACLAQDEWHIDKNDAATARAFREIQHTVDGLPELIGSRDAVHHTGDGQALSRTTLAADADWAIRGNAVWRHECIPSIGAALGNYIATSIT
jgi:hypothetical protein